MVGPRENENLKHLCQGKDGQSFVPVVTWDIVKSIEVTLASVGSLTQESHGQS